MTQFRSELYFPQETASELEQAFNTLLANYRIAYMNTHSFHWMLKGEKFFEIHQKLGELYQEQIEKIDTIAERMLSLGLRPIQTYKEVLEIGTLKEQSDVTDHKEIGLLLLNDLVLLRKNMLDIHKIADEIDDHGTLNQIEGDIQEIEKHIWMWSAFSK